MRSGGSSVMVMHEFGGHGSMITLARRATFPNPVAYGNCSKIALRASLLESDAKAVKR